MTIDGEKVDFCTTYIFKSAGKHTGIVLVDLSLIFTLNSIFNNSEMTSIIFSEKFNTENIKYMNNMFKGCSQLTSINPCKVPNQFPNGYVKNNKIVG